MTFAMLQIWAAGTMPGNASPNDIESNQSSWGIGANITTKLINQTGEVRSAGVVSWRAAEQPLISVFLSRSVYTQ